MDWIEVKGKYSWFKYDLLKAFNKKKETMDLNYPPEEKECTCKYCGEESEKEFCNRDCAKAYEADN